jgi:diadenosine tetraphosphatase ApaH/serine/threonine PP2A family protein phosphatase
VFSDSEAAVAFRHMKARICFHGHSHVPLIISQSADGHSRSRAGHSFQPDADSRYLVNVGSVGQPRDRDCRAAYEIYDNVEEEIILRRVGYDIQAAQKKMAAADLPEVLVSRLSAGV